MHAERDYLHTHVFPELAERLRERYGWIPPEDRMRAAAQEAGFAGEVAGKSITALEIEFGVLASPEQARRSRFYFREPLPRERMDAENQAEYFEESAEACARLAALKDQIQRVMPGRVRRYRADWDPQNRRVTGLEDWGRQVLEDLWEDLEAETRPYATAPALSWREQEDFLLEQFIELGARNFIGRQQTLADLLGFALSPPEADGSWGLCVVGAPGSGKSALFLRLARLLAAEDVLLLSHAAGISPRSSQVDVLLRRWIGQLAPAVGVADPSEGLRARRELERAFQCATAS